MAKSIKIDHSSIRKLEGADNYTFWKKAVENGIWAAGIDGIAFGTEARHATDADAQRKWDVGDRAAMRIIQQRVNEKIEASIIDCSTSNEMWKILADSFGTSAIWTRQELVKKFFGLSLQDKTPSEFLAELQHIAKQLKALGYKNADEETIVLRVIHELSDPQYDSLVETWNSMPLKEQTIPNLLQKLANHASRRADNVLQKMSNRQQRSNSRYLGRVSVNAYLLNRMGQYLYETEVDQMLC